MLDQLDNDIIQTVQQHPEGIQLHELSQKLSKPKPTVRYRLFTLEREKELRLETGRCVLKAFPDGRRSLTMHNNHPTIAG